MGEFTRMAISEKLRAVSCEQNTGSSKAPFRGLGGIWLEDESQRIGQVNIPLDLWNNMRKSFIFFLDIPFEERLKHIVEEYGSLEQEEVIAAIGRISKKLGHLNSKTSILLLKEGKIAESFDILLKYYDKHYFKSLHNRDGINSLLHTVDCKSVILENAKQLLSSAQNQPQKP